jgi:hypothetical protein
MARRHESSHVHWKHLVIYGGVVCLVVIVGGLAIWSFLEKQSLVIAPEKLPKVTVVTADAHSRLAASWVSLLTRAEMQATLVPLDKFDPIEGVIVFCEVPRIPPKLGELLKSFVQRGGALAFVGVPPASSIDSLSAEPGTSDTTIKLSESVSPVLARLNPGYEIAARRTDVAFLNESPRMVVDARWKENARAALMHMEENGARVLWMGFDPDAIVQKDDRQLLLLLRTAFRWVAGQPISDGAVGPQQFAKTLTPDARREARERRFSFSVDRMTSRNMLSIRMTNRGMAPIENPTVIIWLPPRVTRVTLGGDFLMRRNATLTGVPEEGACLITLPSLSRNEDRVMKLRVVDVRAAVAAR